MARAGTCACAFSRAAVCANCNGAAKVVVGTQYLMRTTGNAGGRESGASGGGIRRKPSGKQHQQRGDAGDQAGEQQQGIAVRKGQLVHAHRSPQVGNWLDAR